MHEAQLCAHLRCTHLHKRAHSQALQAHALTHPLARFDLMWLLLDKQDLDLDRRLAQHILGVHQGVVNKVCGNAGAGAAVCGTHAGPQTMPWHEGNCTLVYMPP